MKLYVKNLDINSKSEKLGTIISSKKNNIWLRFHAVKIGELVFELDLYIRKNDKHIKIQLAEDYDCKMTAEDIVRYVEQRIQRILEVLGD